MPAIIDITGQRFGRWTVVGFAGRRNNRTYFRCRCDCGSEKIVTSGMLREGSSRSCGCFSREVARALLMKHGHHGTRLHNIWRGMRQRTGDQRYKDYPNYGGRGIAVCDGWAEFTVFEAWALANGYAEHLTLDRWPDNDGNYEPDNCRWATASEQRRNQRGRLKCPA